MLGVPPPGAAGGLQKRKPRRLVSAPGLLSEGGGDLLSRFRSTIGAARLNFSVRDGKRWDPRAMAALVFFYRAASRGRRYALKKGRDRKRGNLESLSERTGRRAPRLSFVLFQRPAPVGGGAAAESLSGD